MNHLFRDLAPVSDLGWTAIEEEATRSLRHFLAARKLVDFDGPHGWDSAAVNTGRVRTLSTTGPGGAAVREAQALVEVRVPFVVSRAELAAIDRGADDADLDSVIAAARTAAETEDEACFAGWADAGISGIVDRSPHARLAIPGDYRSFPEQVAKAVSTLLQAGVGGPYAVAVGSDCYAGLLETTDEHGRPVLEDVRRLAEGGVVWAPALAGAVVLSIRGGDYCLHVGQDWSIGFSGSSATEVELYLEESLTFRVMTPESAVVLVQAGTA